MAPGGPAFGAGSYKQVLALLESPDPPSRNQGHPLFAGRRGRRLHRLYRLYWGLSVEAARALRRPGASARLLSEDGDTWLEIRDPALNYRRRCLLPPPLKAHFRRHLGLV